MDLKEKMAHYKTCAARETELKAELEKVLREKSEAVKAIAHEIAPKKRIVCEGRELTVVTRGSTYFFKGEGKSSDVVEI